MMASEAQFWGRPPVERDLIHRTQIDDADLAARARLVREALNGAALAAPTLEERALFEQLAREGSNAALAMLRRMLK